MPLVYDLSFGPDFAGQSAVVRDHSGSTVDGSPVTLDADGRAQMSLDEGIYRAVTQNAGRAMLNANTDLTVNLVDSIEAADEGGGGGGENIPTFATVAGVSPRVVPGGPSLTVPFVDAEGNGMPLRTDQFELNEDGALVCLVAGTYEIVLCSAWASGLVNTPGMVEMTTWVSVNEQNKGPAWIYYPSTRGVVEDPNDPLGMVTIVFPQPLDEGDVVAAGVSVIIKPAWDTDIDDMYAKTFTISLRKL